MSVLAHRFPADLDRASVVLPTVKCSSCAVGIPVNLLGEHVCNGPPQYDYRAASPAPSQSHHAHSNSHSNSLAVRAASPSVSSRTPSPRFDALPRLQNAGTSPTLQPGFRIGEVVSSPHSPHMPESMPTMNRDRWPSHDDSGMPPDSPLPPGMPDTTSGGGAGMAGVGRRAFAAAAWSVRAGVALASATGRGFVQDESTGQGIGPSTTTSTSTSPPTPDSPISPSVTTGPGRPNRSPTSRGPVILPKAPLADRPGARSRTDEYRSESRNEDRSVSRNEEYQSVSRNGSTSRHDAYTPRHLERSGSTPTHSSSALGHDVNPQQPTAFFDRYRQMQMMRSKSDQTHTSTPAARDDDATRYSCATSLDETSSLPWATSSTPEESEVDTFEHHRYPTNGSLDSVSSTASHSGDRYGATSSLEAEVVITPSQSWEGLAERSMGVDPKHYNDLDTPGPLALIGEEEEEDDNEGERYVFGAGAPKPLRKTSKHIPRSSSECTVTPNNVGVSPPRRTAQTQPTNRTPPRRTEAAATSPVRSPSRAKFCARCGDAVGGSRRYVERDGIVLCEMDWKKMYLPACRKCKLPIEKSAVSSSDGQLKGKWHRACFGCTRCEAPFDGDDFYVHDGRPWCQYHYAEENNTLCAAASCRKPIEGACILAPNVRGDERFHPGHLRCEHRGGVSGTQSCRDPMTEYYVVGGERYCERHAGKAARRVDGQRTEKRRTKLIELPRGGVLA